MPNNRDDRTPILIESKLNPTNLRLTNAPQPSKFSNFGNVHAWLVTKERSRYFDAFYPDEEKTASKGNSSVRFVGQFAIVLINRWQ